MIQAQSFVFSSYSYNTTTRTATFVYKVHIQDSSTLDFTETVIFDKEFPLLEPLNTALLEKCLYNLHIIIGISYWKAFCPAEAEFVTALPSPEQSEFWRSVFMQGLVEFMYKNDLDIKHIAFPAAEVAADPLVAQLPSRSLAGIGGGKDSLVMIEHLKNRKRELTGFVVETNISNTIARRVTKKADIRLITVTRQIDPQLFSLNKSKKVYNGHVPVSAIYAFIATCCAVLYGFDEVVVGNEKSADEGNVVYKGRVINHQWSKSAEFERLFNNYLHAWVTPSIRYYSPLREFGELRVLEEFSKYPRYFSIFSSCNRNFVIERTGNQLWCLKCPKCAFVFAGLSVFLPRDEVLKIFGADMFADESLVPLYLSLAGKAKAKPFECVGTFAEVVQIFHRLCAHEHYRKTPVVSRVAAAL